MSCAFALITACIAAASYGRRSEDNPNLYLTVTSAAPKRPELKSIVEALKKHCAAVNLKRFDETKEGMEASYRVRFADYAQLEAANNALRSAGESVTVSFIDNEGMASC